MNPLSALFKKEVSAGSKTTSTASVCPVDALQTSSYVGLGVTPPA
jgi:hypothetical protein